MRLIPSKSPCFLYLEGRYCCFGPGSTGAGEIASRTASGDRPEFSIPLFDNQI